MLTLGLQLAIAPVLVAAATLVAGRWDDRAAGVVSALPAIVGPTLLITASHHGADFARTAAEATLLGLVSLSAFVLVYGRAASRGLPWAASFALAWLAAGAAGLALSRIETEPPVGLIAAAASLALAHRALPRGIAPQRLPGGRLAARMLATTALVAALAVAAGRFGPVAGGILAALPVLASVLAVATHRAHGPWAAISLLRGMAAGMAGFVVFCQAVALSGEPAAFVVAAALAVVVQAAVLYGTRPTSATASWGEPSV